MLWTQQFQTLNATTALSVSSNNSTSFSRLWKSCFPTTIEGSRTFTKPQVRAMTLCYYIHKPHPSRTRHDTRVCVRACVRACVRVCVRACVPTCVREHHLTLDRTLKGQISREKTLLKIAPILFVNVYRAPGIRDKTCSRALTIL